MTSTQAHPWDVSPKEAVAIQNRLRNQVEREDHFGSVDHVAGVDVGFEQNNTVTRAAVVVLSFPALQVVDQAIARLPTRFPYVPGLLSFREAPAVLEGLEKLTITPDILLCDGQGIAHPRRFGIASHLGVLTGLPSIGVAKTRLVGSHSPPLEDKGQWVPLFDDGERIGAVLRTRRGVKPLFISSGHRISLESAVHFTMACVTKYRLPETTRWAHHIASRTKGIAKGA